MARHKDENWDLPEGTPIKGGATNHSWASTQVSLLMDLRDELQYLNRLLHCQNFIQIPRILQAIQSNTAKKRRAKK